MLLMIHTITNSTTAVVHKLLQYHIAAADTQSVSSALQSPLRLNSTLFCVANAMLAL
jgi:hypothetical protein